MSQFPFMPLYVDDYIGDTQQLTAEMHGAYLLLLMHMWRRGGWVPNDDRDLARMCRCHPRRWSWVKKHLMPMLIVKDGELSQKRLGKVFGNVTTRYKKGKKGGSLKSLDLPPRSDHQLVRSDKGGRFNENNDITPPKTKTKYKESFNGGAAMAGSPAIGSRSPATPPEETLTAEEIAAIKERLSWAH